MDNRETPPPSFAPGSRPRKRITKNVPTYSHETGPLKIPNRNSRIVKTSNPPSYKPSNNASNLDGVKTARRTVSSIRSNINSDQNNDISTQENSIITQSFKKSSKKLPKKKLIIISVIAVILSIFGGIIFYLIGTYNELQAGIHKKNVLTQSTNNNKGAEVYLIVGNDARSGDAKKSVMGARADTIMVLVKPSNSSGKEAFSVSVPRDTAVTLPDFEDVNAYFGTKGKTVSNYYSKINASYNYGGPTLLIRTIESLSGLKVNHYSEVGFDALEGLTDSLGGIRLCYDKDVNDPASKMKWKAGCHKVNGKQALAFSRMRHQDPEGDLGRAKRQRQVVQKIAQKSTQLFKEGNLSNFWNIDKLKQSAKAGLEYVTFDENASLLGIKSLADVFGEATSGGGEKIIPVITPNGYDSRLGSIVKIDPAAVKEFFQSKI